MAPEPREKKTGMPGPKTSKVAATADEPNGKRRTYNSRSMAERRTGIIDATLAIIEESGLASVTIRNVSRRAGVALRTLYLYFDNREAMISVAIKEFLHRSLIAQTAKDEPETLADVIERLDRLSDVIFAARAYSAALAPIYFSANLDNGIYQTLKGIALSHVFPFLDNLFSATKFRPNQLMRELICAQIANTEYALINDTLAGRLPDEHLATYLKISVLSCIAGYLPKVPKDISEALKDLHATLSWQAAQGPEAAAGAPPSS